MLLLVIIIEAQIEQSNPHQASFCAALSALTLLELLRAHLVLPVRVKDGECTGDREGVRQREHSKTGNSGRSIQLWSSWLHHHYSVLKPMGNACMGVWLFFFLVLWNCFTGAYDLTAVMSHCIKVTARKGKTSCIEHAKCRGLMLCVTTEIGAVWLVVWDLAPHLYSQSMHAFESLNQ